MFLIISKVRVEMPKESVVCPPAIGIYKSTLSPMSLFEILYYSKQFKYFQVSYMYLTLSISDSIFNI